jgi:hypothetical protein
MSLSKRLELARDVDVLGQLLIATRQGAIENLEVLERVATVSIRTMNGKYPCHDGGARRSDVRGHEDDRSHRSMECNAKM